ncbi:MAG TPA: sugar transferase [Kofleriaceae bacterium]|nr:sugar transferase [Kofleriaceae bacterium]
MTPPAARRPVQWAVKRVVDVAGAAIGLAVLSPALALLGAAIRLDSPGGALFRQVRVGRDGRTFEMIKFRTMQAGAPVQFNADGSTRVAAADPRVTRIGRFLRGGLDELPQLINVLRGDMSLVGPRPDLPVHAATYTEAERGKLVVRPGMTSLAAVLGRNEIVWRTRMAIDLRYVAEWSLAIDAKIVAQTLLLPFGRRPFQFRELLRDVELVPSN